MSDLQRYLLVGLPLLFNSLGFLLVSNRISDANVISDLRSDMRDRFEHMEKLFDQKLSRVEEVLDARLRHLEEG
jgi:hypothetical protein